MMIFQGKARVPVTGIFVHCTATPSDWRAGDSSQGRVEAIRQMHIKERGWADIGYHWLIDRDGTVLPGRRETVIGAHVAGHNAGTIGISLFGGLTSKPHDPFLKNFTSRQEVALLDLIGDIRARTAIAWIRGHNEVDSGKACPGFWVPDWLKAERVKV
jgi:N-acetyl-anhydromuramyl-L-alanine amidase AmpD